MKSVVIHAGGSVTVDERPLPQIEAADDVLVEVISSGLCGSDIPRIFHNGAHFYPITPGHEFCGRVKLIGSAVNDIQPGNLGSCVPLKLCTQSEERQSELWSRRARMCGGIGSR